MDQTWPCGQNQQGPVLSVVIPVHNEAATLAEILQRVGAVPGIAKEIIAVDDYSTDGSRDMLKNELAALVTKTAFHEKNQGKGAALRTGIQISTGDFLIIQDADLEYDPADFRQVLAPLLEGRADVVYGSRFLAGPRVRPARLAWRMVNGLLTVLSNLLSGLRVTDMETCYKAFRGDLIRSVRIEEDRFGFEPEITAKIAKIKGVRLVEVPVSYAGRGYSQGKKIGWKDGLRALWCILKYNLLRRSPG